MMGGRMRGREGEEKEESRLTERVILGRRRVRERRGGGSAVTRRQYASIEDL